MTTILSKGLTIKFRQTVALNKVDLIIEENEIVGITGKKGSGKTTLLSILAALKYPSSGTITIDGEKPFENSNDTTNACFTWANQKIKKRGTVGQALKFCSKLRPNWDMNYAHDLMRKFNLNENMKMNKLTSEENAMLNIINGLSSRAPITIFDGTWLTLGYVYRELFFEEIFLDHKKNPRMIFLSTDNADELEFVVNDVIIFDKGEIISHATAAEIVKAAQDIMKTDNLPTLQQVVDYFTGGEKVDET